MPLRRNSSGAAVSAPAHAQHRSRCGQCSARLPGWLRPSRCTLAQPTAPRSPVSAAAAARCGSTYADKRPRRASQLVFRADVGKEKKLLLAFGTDRCLRLHCGLVVVERRALQTPPVAAVAQRAAPGRAMRAGAARGSTLPFKRTSAGRQSLQTGWTMTRSWSGDFTVANSCSPHSPQGNPARGSSSGSSY